MQLHFTNLDTHCYLDHGFDMFEMLRLLKQELDCTCDCKTSPYTIEQRVQLIYRMQEWLKAEGYTVYKEPF